MISIEGERIQFDTPVETGGEFNGVERWLLKSEEMMRQSLTSITTQAMQVSRPRRCLEHSYALVAPSN